MTIRYPLITICRLLAGVLFYDFQELFGVCGLILSWVGYEDGTVGGLCRCNMHKILRLLFIVRGFTPLEMQFLTGLISNEL